MSQPVIAITSWMSVQKVGAAYVFYYRNQVVGEVVVREYGTFVNWKDDSLLDPHMPVLFRAISEYDRRCPVQTERTEP